MPERDPESELSDFTKDFNVFISLNRRKKTDIGNQNYT